MGKRIITTEILEEDKRTEAGLRPQTLDEYIGQEKVKNNLRVYIEAGKAKGRFSGSRTFLRAAGTWKDHPGRDHCQ